MVKLERNLEWSGCKLKVTMTSVEDSNGYSKKRVALRQISKDDDPEAEEEILVGGSFKKAPDSVLANRRIVKVRRSDGTAAPAPALANPFASIRLVPPPCHFTSAETQLEVASEVKAHEGEGKDRTVPVAREDLQEPVSEPATEPLLETVTQTVTVTVSAADSPKVFTDCVINGENVVISSDVKAGENESSRVSVGSGGLSSDTFQQLSSAKNAFSGSFGTGFSAASITFGSTQVTSSTDFGSVTEGVSFGPVSAFGTKHFGSGSGQAAFPSHNSVFGKTNGNNTLQFLGLGTAAAALPTSGLPSSMGITLQEVHVESGEEKEKAVLAADACLFEFLDGGWKERGKGEIKVNVPEDVSRRPRLVMRSKGNLRLLLNANIFPDMKITKMDNRGVTFVCANSIGYGKVGLSTYALKLRDSLIARDFLSTVETHKGTVTSTEPLTPESSPKSVVRSSEAPDEVKKDV